MEKVVYELSRPQLLILASELARESSRGNPLDIEGVCSFLKKGRTTIQSYRKRRINPLPMKGFPPMILEKDAWEWYVNHSGDYQS